MTSKCKKDTKVITFFRTDRDVRLKSANFIGILLLRFMAWLLLHSLCKSDH